VNAHLNSYLQNAPGQWRSFHTEHIIDLRKVIEAALPPGYVALSGQSLQVDVEILPGGIGTHVVIPDVLVSGKSTAEGGASAAESTPSLTLTIEQTLPDTEEYGLNAVAIYRPRAYDDLGKPCVIVELLSPSNKFPHPGYEAYVSKRIEVLQAGLCLVEIDYLHQLRSHILRLPRYPDRQAGAFPYVIILNEPYPTVDEGSVKIYGFHVDDPFPRIRVPLLGNDSFMLDLSVVYTSTYEARRLHETAVDYEQLPVRFETYSDVDQQRIRTLLLRVQQEQS
jgi:hypothetical protein